MWTSILSTVTTEHRRWIRIALVGAVAALAYYFLEKEVKAWLAA